LEDDGMFEFQLFVFEPDRTATAQGWTVKGTGLQVGIIFTLQLPDVEPMLAATAQSRKVTQPGLVGDIFTLQLADLEHAQTAILRGWGARPASLKGLV
jgi:hypothetical protein